MSTDNNTNDATIPAFFRIDESEVAATYDFGSFTLTRAAQYMCYNSKGGYHLFVDGTNESLFVRLAALLDYAIEQKKEGKENKETNDEDINLQDIADYISTLLFAPAFIMTNDDLMSRQFSFLVTEMENMLKVAQETLQKQDFDKNNEFMISTKAAEELKDDILKLAENIEENEEA